MIATQPRSSTLTRLTAPIILIALPLVACQGESPAESLRGRRSGELIRIEPASVRSAAASNLRDHASEVFAFLRFLEHSDALSPFIGEAACAPDPELPCGFDEPDAGEIEEGMREIADALFDESLIMDSSDERIVYRIDRRICDGDSDCLDLLDRFDPRLIVTARRPGDVDIDLVFGEEETLLAIFDLHFDDLTIAIELAPARDILEVAFGDEEDLDALLPDVADGLLVATLGDVGTGLYAAELSAPRGLLVASEAGDYRLEVDSSAAPWLSVRYDEEAQTVRAVVDLPATSADLPTELFDFFPSEVSCAGTPDGAYSCGGGSDYDMPEGTLSLDLAGASAAIELGASAPLAVTGLSLGAGPSTVSFDGLPVLSVELNQSLGHVLDLQLSERDSTLRFAPGLEIDVSVQLENLGLQRDDVPAWALDDVSKLSLTGDQGAASVQLYFSDETETGALARVTEGTLELRSSQASSPIVVSEGRCLFSVDRSDDDQHPFSALFSGDCE